jgi:hypothetical protein
MNHAMKQVTTATMGLLLFTAVSLKATPVTVQEVGTGNGTDVYIDSSVLGNNQHVFAGFIKLEINGSPTLGFCIDPWHWSDSNTQTYDLVSLDQAPKFPGPMGADAALKIEKLWQKYYAEALGDSNKAAALQIVIWEQVDIGVTGGTTFSVSSAHPLTGLLLDDYNGMKAWLGSGDFLNTTPADLDAVKKLSPTGVGQDYVIPGVPDGGSTAALLGVALMAIAAFRRRLV